MEPQWKPSKSNFLFLTCSRNNMQISPEQDRKLPANKDGDKFMESFLERTSITALNQVHATKHTFIKVLWVLTFIIGLVMASYQTYGIIIDYQRFSVVETTFKQIQHPIMMPSVTVCSNLQLYLTNYTYNNNQYIKTFVDSIRRKSNKILGQTLPSHLSKNTLEIRRHLGVPIDEFVKFCSYGGHNCRPELQESNNLLYGNCVTFNPNQLQYNGENISVSTSINMIMDTFAIEQYYDIVHVRSSLVLLHPSGTAPYMPRHEIIRIFPGEWVHITVTKKTTFRLPYPYSSQCLDIDSPAAQWLSLYHDHESPYRYTMEACLASCLQNLTITYCDCFMTTLPFKNITSMEGRFLEPCEHACHRIPDVELQNVCGCRKSCKSQEFVLRLERHPRQLGEENFVRQVFNYDAQHQQTDNYTGLSVVMATDMVEITREEPEYTGTTMLGSIGGAFGLWIGVSIVTVFEGINAFWIAIKRCCCRRRYLQK